MIYKVNAVKNPHDIKVSVPGSKSITNRALLIAALSNGSSTLKGVLFSDDSRHFIQALIDLGFNVDVDEDKKEITIEGLGGDIPNKNAEINVGSAGTAARFLTAFLGLSEGRYTIDSSEQMKKRPMKELLVALEGLGAHIEYLEEKYHFPLIIGNDGNTSSHISIDVDKSSQFLSALLISSVLFKNDFKISVTGNHGMAYVEMTIAMMKQFGVEVTSVSDCDCTAQYIIGQKAAYSAMDYDIEPDLSAACYFYAMGAVLNVESTVYGVHQNSLQGDIAFIDVLTDMGCSYVDETDGIKLIPSKSGRLKGGEWDLSAFSDQTLTLAAIAPFAESEVSITKVGHIRLQECDRMEAILHNLSAMGILAREKDGNLTISPGEIKPCSIETYEDHRVAMSFTIPGLIKEGFEIIDPMCCRKTFETYYEVLESIY